MPASNAFAAIGGKLKRGDGGSPEAFTDVAELVDISGPSGSLAMIEVTNLGSPGSAREYIASLIDNGTVSCQANFDPTNSQQSPTAGIISDRDNRVKRNWKVVWSNAAATTAAFAGFIESFSTDQKTGDKAVFNFAIRIVGAITWS